MTASAADCCTACTKESGCQRWTYEPASQQCQLKGFYVNAVARAESIAGVYCGANAAPVSTDIPEAVAVAGFPLFVDVSKSFSDPDGDRLSFSVLKGLPLGTGLSLDAATGIINGSPLLADKSAVQPLEIDVIASDTRGLTAVATLYLTVASGLATEGKAVQLNIAASIGPVGTSVSCTHQHK
jgi:hypothetical protein